jgi:hypothetical protein
LYQPIKQKDMELILTDIELAENKSNDNTFDVWYNDTTGGIVALENGTGGRRFRYKLSKEVEDLTSEEQREILEYRLGRVTADDEVTVADVFMHGKFIEIIL